MTRLHILGGLMIVCGITLIALSFAGDVPVLSHWPRLASGAGWCIFGGYLLYSARQKDKGANP